MKAIIYFLVVVAALFVLAAVLFPVFAQSKASAKRTGLESRLKALETQLDLTAGNQVSFSSGKDSQPKLTLASLVTAPRSIVRIATIQVRVDSIDQTEKKVQALVGSVHGYVDKEDGTDLSTDEPQLTIKLRIPQETFDATLAEIEKLGVRRAKTVSSEDVTEQIVDMDARLKTMVAQEETYRAILKTQRGVQGVMDVQDHLMSLREQIESVTAQRKSLAGQASLSTIEVTLVQKADIAVAASGDPNWLGQGWAQAWTAGIMAFRGLTLAGVWLLVFSPAWLTALLIVRHYRRTARTAIATIEQ